MHADYGVASQDRSPVIRFLHCSMPRCVASAGEQLSPFHCSRRRKRTDRRRRTRAPIRRCQAACRASPGPLPFADRHRLTSLSVTFPGGVPELAIDPGDSGDEAVGFDGAKDRPCFGIELMDLPVPMLPHPERPFGPGEPRARRRWASEWWRARGRFPDRSSGCARRRSGTDAHRQTPFLRARRHRSCGPFFHSRGRRRSACLRTQTRLCCRHR